MFNAALLFSSAIRNPYPESSDVLGDLQRIQTLAPGPADRNQAMKILDLFGFDPISLPLEHPHEKFWEMIFTIKMQVLHQMESHGEWRVDWSRIDKAFCLWHRHRDASKDATRNLDFVRKSTVNNIHHTSIQNSREHGFGLFAEKDFEKDTLLTILDGQVMSKEHYENLQNFFALPLHNLKNHFFMEWNAISANRLLVRSMRTKYSYINHSAEFANVALRHGQKCHLIELISIKPLPKGSELLIDYRMEPLPRSYFSSPTAFYLHPTGIEL